MFDLRYHVVSLVAIFLAIGLGIILGSVIVDKGTLVQQQNTLIKSVREDLDDLRLKNQELSLEVKNHDNFQKESFPWLVDNRLMDKRIGLFSFDGKERLETQLTSLISRSGGKAVTFKIGSYADYSFDTTGYLQSYFKSINTAVATETLPGLLESELVKNLFITTDQGFVENMISRNVVTLSDKTALPLDAVVFAADGLPKKDLEMLKIFSESGIKMTGVMTTVELPGIPGEIENIKASFIDNLDTIPGQVALILVLQGSDGVFGNNSQNLLPDYIEP